MMATSNSKPRRAAIWKPVAAIFIFLTARILAGEDAPKNPTANSAAFAGKELARAESLFESNTNNLTSAWYLARAAFDFAEFATNDTQRAALANRGIAASRLLTARAPEAAAGHYYLAMNLGQLARTKFIGALSLVKQMEPEFRRAGELDARFDHAGPERNLGLLYREAPGWPISLGNSTKARTLLRNSVKLAPEYPENYLHLIESYLKWNDREGAKRELRSLDAIWPAARKNFTGAKWEQSWDNWATRRDAARKQLADATAP